MSELSLLGSKHCPATENELGDCSVEYLARGLMTEQQRNHLLRMVKHAEKVRRNMDNLRRTNEPLTKEETAKVLRKWKRKYPDFFERK